MKSSNEKISIALIGGGPSALFMYKQLAESNHPVMEITIFEKSEQLGAGMPYSTAGANPEHLTNVSGNEIPPLISSVKEWLFTAPHPLLAKFGINPQHYSEYKVVPRLLFGQYLNQQFESLIERAKRKGIKTKVWLATPVTDIGEDKKKEQVIVKTGLDKYRFDVAVICTGHCWPRKWEGQVPGYFDSPYPPSKLQQKVNFPVAIRGASLTAIDAVRTLARYNGQFAEEEGKLSFALSEGSENFRLVLHSLDGLLPAIRFHLEDPLLSKEEALSDEEVIALKETNDGFVPLDFLFEQKFKKPISQRDPEFYETIKGMNLEEFVEHMMSLRERLDAFELFKAEYAEAETSIRRRQSVYWKEELAVLSFVLNHPAKHFSAEDMMRLKKVLMPLISIVIAFVPQSSCKELLALQDAGVLSLVAVDRQSKVTPQQGGGAVYSYTDTEGKEQQTAYAMFVDCMGQPQFMATDFPFKSLREEGSISAARLAFKSPDVAIKESQKNELVQQDANGRWWLQVPGIAINDYFQVLDQYGATNSRIYMMAVPYIGGFNPDYSGLDFGEAASARISKAMLQNSGANNEASV